MAHCATDTGERFAACLALCLTGADGARNLGGAEGRRGCEEGRWSSSRGAVVAELQLLDLVGDCA